MKHVILSDHWSLETNPSAALVCTVNLGAKRFHQVNLSFPVMGGIKPDEKHIFKENEFILKCNREGAPAKISPGEDRSNSCLLCVGSSIGGRGTVEVFKRGTTGAILRVGDASVARHAACEALVLLEEGQTVTFHAQSWTCDSFYKYIWDGKEIIKEVYDGWEEWENKNK